MGPMPFVDAFLELVAAGQEGGVARPQIGHDRLECRPELVGTDA